MKKRLLLCAKVLVSAGLVAFVLERLGLGRVLTELGSARPSFLALAAGLFLASHVLGALQWSLLLRVQDIRLPFGKVFSLYLVGVFFNNFLISNMGGDVIRVNDVRKISGDGSSALAATFLDRFIGLFSLMGFSFVAYFVVSDLAAWRSVGALIVLVGLLLAGVGVLMLSYRVGGTLERVLVRLVPQRVAARVTRTRQSFYLYRSHKGTLGLAWLISLGVQVLRVGLHWAAGRSLGVTIGFDYFLLFVPLIAVVASVPISFGGIGVRENFGVYLFQRVGVAPTTAFSMGLLAYLMGLVASLPGGVIFILRGTSRRGAAEPRGSAGRPTA